jgi:hypothetical protein
MTENELATSVVKVLGEYQSSSKDKKHKIDDLYIKLKIELESEQDVIKMAKLINALGEAISDPENALDSDLIQAISDKLNTNSVLKADLEKQVKDLTTPAKVPPVMWSDNRTMILVFVSLIAMFIFGYLGPGLYGVSRHQWGWNWALVWLFMLFFLIVLGKHSNGKMAGILINSRNLMSLSRLQIVLWTMVILSAYLTIVLERIHASMNPFAYNVTLNSTLLQSSNLVSQLQIQDPLGVGIDWRLWALLGISTASLVGTPLIMDSKKKKEPKAGAVNKSGNALGENPAQIEANREGTAYANENLADAKLTDIIEGDEVGNTAYVDLSNVQMFLFTLIAVFAYAVQVYQAINITHPAFINSLPELPEGLIAILLISHAGYLTNKAVDHTQLSPPVT